MSTLKIVIKAEWFDEIRDGKKKVEYRDTSPFWDSRLYDDNGKKRSYETIEFINGYNKNARRMVTEFGGFSEKEGTFHIRIGNILKK